MNNHFQKEDRIGIRHETESWRGAFPEMPYGLNELSSGKVKALVHALRVHQAELEMQNAELRRTQLELQAVRDEYVNLFDFSPVGYITTTSDGVILRANMTVSGLLGAEPASLAGESLSRFVSKEAQDSLYFHRKELSGIDGAQTCELVMVKADGSEFDARLESIPVADSRGKFTQIRTAVSDISERKKMEKALRESEEQLRLIHKMTAIGTMAGGIAHDFNNLLMVILGNIELAENWARGNNKKIEENLETARRACMRAAGIIRQILHVSRQKNVPRKPVRMTTVVEASLARLNAVPGGIEVKRKFLAENDTVIADAGLIQQVLSNLYDNALQAMEEKGGSLTIGLINEVIETETASSLPLHLLPGRYLKLSVSDTGKGIDRRILDQIFTPYFTTKGIGRGLGLGLAEVYGILLNHNARISVSTAWAPDLGRKTCRVLLPSIPALFKSRMPSSHPRPGFLPAGCMIP